MKVRTSMFCFFLIFACAGLLLSRLDSRRLDGAAGVVEAVETVEAGEYAAEDTPSQLEAEEIAVDSETVTPRCTIAVDAGHGGRDSGKVGVNGAKEKDVNLKIAQLLAQYLESQNIHVVMTRTEDKGLYSEDSSDKKAEDMRNRVALIRESGAQLLVSIHQNSYTQSGCTGAQVFYYTGSEEGEKLAKTVQSWLIAEADPQNHREAKENSAYYLLKKSAVPAIICECGFLSNPEECEKLCTPEYQQKIAVSIFQGIMEYLDTAGL